MGGMVTIFDPQGNKGAIPQERLVDAVKAGAKPAVTMKAPDGTLGEIPADRLQDAVKAGASVVPFEQQENQHAGVWHTIASNLSGLLRPSGFNPYPGMGQDEKAAAAGQAHEQDQQRAQEGRSAAYRAVVPFAQSVGVNVPGMEQSAREGDVGGVIGHAAVPLVALGAGEALGHGIGLAKDALPSARRAGQAFQDIKAAAGNVPIDTAKVGNSALDLYTQSQRGATLPPAVNKLVRRLSAPDSPPMTYAEAKDFQSNISNLSANEKMNLKPNQVRLVGQLNADLKASLADAADTVGKGQQFKQAMVEYHNAMKLKGYSDEAINAAWKAAIGAAGVYGAAKVFGMANEAPGH
jgi:hypothetical protein